MSKRFDGRLLPITADVTQEETVTEAINRIIAEAGGLHGMVVNAGKTHHKAALDFTPDEVNNLFAINVSREEFDPLYSSLQTFLADNSKLFGAFFCARAAARAFMKQGVKGSIVFTASMASYRPNKVRCLIFFFFFS